MILSSVIGLGLLFDKLQIQSVQRIRKDTQVYVLKLLGEDRSIKNTILAALVAAIVSIAAGVTEEILFRGELLPFFTKSLLPFFSQFSEVISLAITSIIFGLLHFPTFGLSALVEIALGGFFGWTFLAFNNNLLIPIIVHSVYDFITILISWLTATKELEKSSRAGIDALNKIPYQETIQKVKNIQKRILFRVYVFLNSFSS